MTTLLDVSHKIDQASIDLLLAVDSTATALGVTYCIIGAFARDVMLGLCFGIDTGEATRDIDFGLLMDDWSQFDELRARLIAKRGFAEHKSIRHRLTFRGVREIDIVPFGGIERKPGEIAWPPEFTTVMSTVGLRQAHARALHITIAEGHSVPFASPAALTLLKLIAWNERGNAINRRDARDLGLLLTTYLRAGNEERLYGEHAALLDEADFDFDGAGARILGRDLAGIAGPDTCVRLEQILEQGMDRARGEPLLRDLPLPYEEARRLLVSTFGRRLRAAGVSFEDRQDLLGRRSGRITTHYSQAELGNLIEAAEKVCESESRKLPATTWLRRRASTLSF